MPKRTTRAVKSLVPRQIPLRLPLISPRMYMPLLVVLLIIASFLLGVLVTKVQYLEKGVSVTAGDTSGTAGAQAGVTSAPVGPVNVSIGKHPIQGNKNAKVTVIEFADFQCPFCEQWFKEVEPSIKKDYIDTGKIQFAFRDYAFLGDESTFASEAAYCADDQGKFWDFHDYLYSHQGSENSGTFSKDNLKGFAASLGLDTAKFNDCLDTDKYKNQVTQDQSDGTAAGVNGTPATFVDGVQISGAQPYATFKAAIDKELAK